MKPSRQNVGEHRQVENLGEGLIFVRKFQQVEVGIGHHHKLGLASDPTTHIDVTVSSPGPIAVHVQANSRVALAAGAAASTRDVEGNRNNVADLEIFDVLTELDDFTGDLVTEHHADGSGGAATNHVLIGTADIGGNDFQDDAVLNRFARRVLELGVINGLDLYFSGAKKYYAFIICHDLVCSSSLVRVQLIIQRCDFPRADEVAQLEEFTGRCSRADHDLRWAMTCVRHSYVERLTAKTGTSIARQFGSAEPQWAWKARRQK